MEWRPFYEHEPGLTNRHNLSQSIVKMPWGSYPLTFTERLAHENACGHGDRQRRRRITVSDRQASKISVALPL